MATADPPQPLTLFEAILPIASPIVLVNIASPLLTIAITAADLRVLQVAPALANRAERHAPLADDG
jgi:hypothetical protein